MTGEEFILTMLAQATLWKPTNKKSSVLICGSMALHTLKHSISEEIKCAVRQLQPASQPGIASAVKARGEPKPRVAGYGFSYSSECDTGTDKTKVAAQEMLTIALFEPRFQFCQRPAS